MKEITLYTCECCGTQYNDKSMALDCERTHKHFTRICNVGYRYAKEEFPDQIEVEFTDGTRLWYKY